MDVEAPRAAENYNYVAVVLLYELTEPNGVPSSDLEAFHADPSLRVLVAIYSSE